MGYFSPPELTAKQQQLKVDHRSDLRRSKMGGKFLYRRNFIGGNSLKQRYEMSPVNGKIGYFPPPESDYRENNFVLWRLAHLVRNNKLILTLAPEEAINTPVCPLQEKFHTFIFRGLRNISEAP